MIQLRLLSPADCAGRSRIAVNHSPAEKAPPNSAGKLIGALSNATR